VREKIEISVRTVIEEPDHFGHDFTNSRSRNPVRRWANLTDLDDLAIRLGMQDEHDRSVLDLMSKGYNKLLGGGTLQKPVVVLVAKVTATAKQ
jgi:large subunit ribosomal protein L15